MLNISAMKLTAQNDLRTWTPQSLFTNQFCTLDLKNHDPETFNLRTPPAPRHTPQAQTLQGYLAHNKLPPP